MNTATTQATETTTRTTDGIMVGRDENGLYNFAGTYEHRGNLTPAQRDAVFAIIPTLTYAEIPAAIKRVRAGKSAAKPEPKREKSAVWTPDEIRARANGFIVCPKATANPPHHAASARLPRDAGLRRQRSTT